MKPVAWTWVVAAACLFGPLAGARAQESPRQPAASSPQFPQLPLRRDEPETTSLGAFAWVAGLLIVGVAGAWYWRRRMAPAPARPSALAIMPARSLTAHASLHVVRWEHEELLLACTPQNVTVISRRPIAPTDESPAVRPS